MNKYFLEFGNHEEILSRLKEERKMLDKGQLVAGLKQIIALFEEADGLWINLQGKDRKERLEENKIKSSKWRWSKVDKRNNSKRRNISKGSISYNARNSKRCTKRI